MYELLVSLAQRLSIVGASPWLGAKNVEEQRALSVFKGRLHLTVIDVQAWRAQARSLGVPQIMKSSK